MISIARHIRGIAIKGIPGNQSIIKILAIGHGRKGKKGNNEEVEKRKKFSLHRREPEILADDVPANHYLIL